MHPDPDLVVILSFATAMLIGFPIARAVAGWINRKASGPPPQAVPADLTQRLERLEHIAEATQIEVERMAEGQRFTTRLLAERLQASALPAEERPGATLRA
jgi:hypothetical protein